MRGFIVSNVNTENWFANSIAIEDSFTSPESGITVTLPEMPSYAAGVEVAVPLADAVLYRNDAGYLVLEASGADSTDVTPVEVKPLSVDYTALASGKYESMYVSSTLQITDAGLSGVLGDCPLLEDEDGNNVRLKVMEESALALSQAKMGRVLWAVSAVLRQQCLNSLLLRPQMSSSMVCVSVSRSVSGSCLISCHFMPRP